MGCFSWMFADTDNEEALNIGESAYVACPDGTVIYEQGYDGYGEFDGHDVYDLVAEWNRDYISEANVRRPLRERLGNTEQDEKWFQAELKEYENDCQRLKDFISGKSDEYMKEKYGETYKRSIGLDIACYDEENAVLKYPIKICKEKPVGYDLIPASKGDPNQGFGEGWDECDEYDEYDGWDWNLW